MKNYYVAMLLLWFTVFNQPVELIDGQAIKDSNTARPIDSIVLQEQKKQQVVEQEKKKQSLFKQAFSNQDTVTLLISKKAISKPIIVRKRQPVLVPIAADTSSVYIPINRTVKYNTLAPVPLIVVHTIVVEVPKKKHKFLYRLFHWK